MCSIRATSKPAVGTSTTKHDSRVRLRRGRVRIGDREDRHEVRDGAVADEPFRAGEDVVVAIADGLGPDRPDVRARLGLGQRERDEVFPGREPRQPARVLLERAGEDDRQRRELVDREDQAGRRARPAELLDREADRQQIRVEAAELRRERQRQDVLRGEQLAQVLRELAGPVDLRGPRRDALIGEGADGVSEERLLLGQSVAGLHRLGHRPHRISGTTATTIAISARGTSLASMAAEDAQVSPAASPSVFPSGSRNHAPRAGPILRDVVRS